MHKGSGGLTTFVQREAIDLKHAKINLLAKVDDVWAGAAETDVLLRQQPANARLGENSLDTYTTCQTVGV
jgi:hypothetical protein